MNKWRQCPTLQILNCNCSRYQCRGHFTTFLRKAPFSRQLTSIRGTGGGGSNGGIPQGNSFLVPGATVATILMLGALHARRLYDDKKIEEAKAKGIEIEFHPDVKARFLRLVPLRCMSRFWGSLTGVELPIWLRPYVYKAWARAFHSNLEEAELPLEEYRSLRQFFVRRLKGGSRPTNSDPCSLVSPVDGIVLRFGELRGPGAMIEQVKGCSYSASSFLGANSHLPMIAGGDASAENVREENSVRDVSQKSWWRISLGSPEVRDNVSSRPLKGLFYCVIYLRPGDYHRIHSPVDWNILVRRHFTGNLFPVNERATRTIRNLYVENERVVLEGQWQEGYMAMAAVGATNIGSIELFIEPTLRTNSPRKSKRLLHPELPQECAYEPEGKGVALKKGDEVAAFNMGSTVVLIFQAPIAKSLDEEECSSSSSEFRFHVKKGDRVRVGEVLGRWNDS